MALTKADVAGGGTGATSLTDHGVLLGSGTGAVSVTSAGTSGQVLTSGGSGADPAWADAGGGGLEYVTQYRMAASVVSGYLTSNWEVADTDGAGGIGTAVGESSGIFSFPSTGIWLMEFTAQAGNNPNTQVNGLTANIYTSVDNGSNYSLAAQSFLKLDYYPTSSNTTTSFLFDVTSIAGATTHLAKFQVVMANTGTYQWYTLGATDYNFTHVTFTKLGDT